MVRIRECSFCAIKIKPGTGMLFVKTDGSTRWYCSSKCKKSDAMKRNPRKLKWTNRYESKR
ncbi:MAG: 50S ribosomal protein L24e [Promethearchaeota archaeon]